MEKVKMFNGKMLEIGDKIFLRICGSLTMEMKKNFLILAVYGWQMVKVTSQS